MEMHRSLAKQDLILNTFVAAEYISQGLLRTLNPLMAEFLLNNNSAFNDRVNLAAG
jgi:hypothetical protein